MKQVFITLNNLSKIYNGQYILKDINYEFKEGLYVVNGINGSGKSTLVKLITKIINPSDGKVISKSKICYLPEKFELPRSMTSFNIINLYIKNKIKTKMLLNEWEIPNKRLSSLSKGNFQKLGILLMISQTADVYIFDEPTDSLDVQVVNVFKQAVKYLRDKNKCVIVILHQLNIDELKPIKLKIDGGELCLN